MARLPALGVLLLLSFAYFFGDTNFFGESLEDSLPSFTSFWVDLMSPMVTIVVSIPVLDGVCFDPALEAWMSVGMSCSVSST